MRGPLVSHQVRHSVNALVRLVRDLRFALADRYRALLASRFVALAALAAGVLDRSLALVVAARRLRHRSARTPEHAASLADAALGAGRQLSVIVRDASGGSALVLRRGSEALAVETLADTVTDTVGSVVRLVGVLPAAAAGGAPWTVALTDVAGDGFVELGTDRRAAAALAAPLGTDERGCLTVRIDPDAALGLVPELVVGVRTMLVSWPAEADTELRLVPAGDAPETVLPAPVHGARATATVELAGLGVSVWTAFVGDRTDPAGRVPLGFPRERYPRLRTAHRIWLPADTVGPARLVTVGYDAGNRLTVGVAALAAAAS